jgi:4-hydroxy-tetrahydrodipicolinate reductase
VRWQTEVDEISIEHRAHSREGFANGAVMAAKWLVGKQGFFGMNEVLGI